MIALPQYLDQEAWSGFVEMRRTIKKPLTVRAAKMVLGELQKIKDAGHCPNAALDQSTNHCWADVYVPKEKEIARKVAPATTSADEHMANLDSRRETMARPPAQLLSMIRRRVA